MRTHSKTLLLPGLIAAMLLVGAPALPATAEAPGPGGTLCIGDVTIVDPVDGKLLPNRFVVIKGARIATVGSSEPAHCSRSLEGRGRYLIPGLWDMHVHGTRRPATYPLYLANGVTGVREMFGPKDPSAFREELARSGVDAPRMFIASPVLDGSPPIWPNSEEITTADGARRAVNEYAERGADFIKVYQRLSRREYFAIAAEASRIGIPIAGHVPSTITPWEATAAGQTTVEHMTQIPLACSSDESLTERKSSVRSYTDALRLQVDASRSYAPAKCNLLFDAFKRNGTWVVPTLTALRSDGWRNEKTFTSDDRLSYFHGDTRAWLAPSADEPPESFWKEEDRIVARDLFRFIQKVIGEMFRADVPILAGTDALNPYVFPGFSLHDELELLVEAGLTPLAALRAATLEPARFMGATEDFGSVAPGRVADLVLLEADPLEDIANTRRIVSVVLGGKLFERSTIDAMLEDAAAGGN